MPYALTQVGTMIHTDSDEDDGGGRQQQPGGKNLPRHQQRPNRRPPPARSVKQSQSHPGVHTEPY